MDYFQLQLLRRNLDDVIRRLNCAEQAMMDAQVDYNFKVDEYNDVLGEFYKEICNASQGKHATEEM